MAQDVEGFPLGVDRPPQLGQIGPHRGDLHQEVGVGGEGPLDELLVAVVEHVKHAHEPAGGYVGQPSQRLVGTAGGQLGPAQDAVPEHVDRRRALLVDGDEPALGQEAVELVGLDPLLAQRVQHHQHERPEVVHLGKVDVLHRVPHREGVEPHLLHELGQFVVIVAPGGDVDPHPAPPREVPQRARPPPRTGPARSAPYAAASPVMFAHRLHRLDDPSAPGGHRRLRLLRPLPRRLLRPLLRPLPRRLLRPLL